MAAEIRVQAAFEGEIGLGERDVWPVSRLSVDHQSRNAQLPKPRAEHDATLPAANNEYERLGCHAQ